MPSPHDFSFRKLMDAKPGPKANALFTELLRHGPSLFDPLSIFILGEEQNPRVAVLVTLLGKTMDERAIPMLIKLLDSSAAETRRAAANALGWNRAPAAIEALDRMEGVDPDASAREEASRAIEEILNDYPGLEKVLKVHGNVASKSTQSEDVEGSSVTEEGPATPKARSAEDKAVDQEKLKLIMMLPRLLAFKYRTAPLRMTPSNELLLAIEMGREHRMIAPLANIAGLKIKTEPWPMDRVHDQIEKLYTLGDDDFAGFFDHLNEVAQNEIMEIVVAGIHPNEPAPPLDEANDGLEAAQAFLSACVSSHARNASVENSSNAMNIYTHSATDERAEVHPPVMRLRERFFNTLAVLASYNEGTLRTRRAAKNVFVELKHKKSPDGGIITINFQEEQERS